jgi:hypothetical protein
MILLSKLVEKQISYHAATIAKFGAMNEVAKIADGYEEAFPNRHYWSDLNSYGGVVVNIQVTSADQALEALEWFREHGFKSEKFTDDGDAGSRTYTLKNDTECEITLRAYFTGGTCEFVATGKRKHVKSVAALPGRYEPIMELKCEGIALPKE